MVSYMKYIKIERPNTKIITMEELPTDEIELTKQPEQLPGIATNNNTVVLDGGNSQPVSIELEWFAYEIP